MAVPNPRRYRWVPSVRWVAACALAIGLVVALVDLVSPPEGKPLSPSLPPSALASGCTGDGPRPGGMTVDVLYEDNPEAGYSSAEDALHAFLEGTFARAPRSNGFDRQSPTAREARFRSAGAEFVVEKNAHGRWLVATWQICHDRAASWRGQKGDRG